MTSLDEILKNLKMERCGDLRMIKDLKLLKLLKLSKNKKGKESYISYEEATEYMNFPDDKIARLMELIGCAIEDWAKEYNMENLPKKIIFEQVLDAMHALEIAMNNTNES